MRRMKSGTAQGWAKRMASGMDKPQTATIDLLRGISALYVVVNHTRGLFFVGGQELLATRGGWSHLSLPDVASLAVLQLTSMGHEFVIVFFCLSGIAMAHSIGSGGGALRFYQRRILRLWPPYLLAILFAVACCYLVAWLKGGSASCWSVMCSPQKLMGMAFYIDVISPMTAQFWSLPYEVLFYIICPLVLVTLASTLMSATAAAVFALIGAFTYGITLNPSGIVIVDFLTNALPWFMAGALGYRWFHRVPVMGGWKLVLLTVGALALVYGIKTAVGETNLFSSAIMVAATLMLVRNIPVRLAQNRLLNLGHFSYSLYIFHAAIIIVFSAIYERVTGQSSQGITAYFGWVLLVPFVVGLSWMLYLVSEKPSNAALQRLRRRSVESTTAANLAA